MRPPACSTSPPASRRPTCRSFSSRSRSWAGALRLPLAAVSRDAAARTTSRSRAEDVARPHPHADDRACRAPGRPPIGFIPFLDLIRRVAAGLEHAADAATDIVLNVMLFMPLGAWSPLRLGRRWMAPSIVGGALSIGIEPAHPSKPSAASPARPMSSTKGGRGPRFRPRAVVPLDRSRAMRSRGLPPPPRWAPGFLYPRPGVEEAGTGCGRRNRHRDRRRGGQGPRPGDPQPIRRARRGRPGDDRGSEHRQLPWHRGRRPLSAGLPRARRP